MAVGLQLIITSGQGRTLERTFPRPPFFIGREFPSQCILEDPLVSKIHACVDVREGMICVRDVGSLNGTYVRDQRIAPDKWIAVARVDQIIELRIATWNVRIQACAVEEPAPSVSSTTLARMLEETAGKVVAAADGSGTVVPPTNNLTGTLAVPEMQMQRAQAQQLQHAAHFDARAAIGQLGGLYGASVGALNQLYVATAKILEKTPEGARPHLCAQLAGAYPMMAKDPSFIALFRHFGWSPSGSIPPPNPLGHAALSGLQEMARWYLGDDRPLTSEADIVAFKDKLRATLDELLVGYVPLAAGLDTFEKQMALKSDPTAAGTTPAQLARRLLDWRGGSDDALRRIRESFADLMMHQVALLNGLMRGVKALLTELSPPTIEKAAMRKRGRTFFLFRLFRRADPWGVYKERHGDLSDEENERFRVLFGPEFAAEYRQFTRDARASEGSNFESGVRAVSGTPPPPPALPVRAAGQEPWKSGTR
jgi:type VI secretion system protein ImpI